MSTPRLGRERSPRKPEPQPGHSTSSPIRVAMHERPSALCACGRGKVESGDDIDSGSGDERDRREEGLTPLVRPASSQEGDRRVVERPRPEWERVTGAGLSADVALAILNGLDISSLPALRDLSIRASSTVQIPWPPAGLEQATPEWRPRPWRSSWEAKRARGIATGTVH